ncbi:hypothetical protein [Budvicia aquatica]|uniref:Uncharacterized protein n=1 Tax=Budvicia aquatica TaxID=82979 RepID=A0A2C6DTT7_9GAMM|nr:hypothetical protein [Budvicia aquatica]PHI31742.1 hypothetical protein CRN84_21625 [Budvicia aquatica]VFS52611.1 Uncharacterised protein [Budvicia aquatica]
MNDGLLRLSAQKALLYYLFPKVRMISMDVVDSFLHILFIVSDELTEDEKDMIYTVGGQIEGDFLEITDRRVDYVVSKDNIDEQPQLRLLVLAQFE